MNASLTLLGPTAEKVSARMGFTPYTPAKDIAASAAFVKQGLCLLQGCLRPLSKGQHGWTCSLHDPMNAKRRSSPEAAPKLEVK